MEKAANHCFPKTIQVIAPSLGKRFSGINASMLAVIPEQTQLVDIAAIGFHIDGPEIPKITFAQLLKHGRTDSWRIWHARRNIDMLTGLILKFIFRFKLVLIFTSAAQRHHSGITRFYCKHMDEIITPTSAAASYLTRPAVVVPHGVDTTRFFPPEQRDLEWKKRNLPGRYGIGIIGRVRPNKGTREFVEAAIQTLKSRPEWTAVIIGQTTPEHLSFEQELRALIKKEHLEDRILFIGFLKDPAQIPIWLRSLSLVACTSHNEGFGLPCLEAMASGCPVIATHTGAWPEIIEDNENGLLIPIQNSNALADSLAKLMDDTDRRNTMGLEARNTILNRYQIKNEAEGIQTVYEKIFHRHNPLTWREKPEPSTDSSAPPVQPVLRNQKKLPKIKKTYAPIYGRLPSAKPNEKEQPTDPMATL